MKFDRDVRMEVKLIKKNLTDFTLPLEDQYRGTLDIRNLRISFAITKTQTYSTNTATISIYNLSQSKRNEISDIFDEVRLFAGYKKDSGAQLIFMGDTSKISHTYSGAEIISNFTCGDGEKIINNIKIAGSYGGNLKVKTVLESIANQIQMKIAYPIPLGDEVYAFGLYDSTLARNMIDSACNKAGLIWGVQNGKLVFYKKNSASPKPPVLINAESGMIGIPERYTSKKAETLPLNKNVGWRVRSLLRPDISPGDSIRLKSSVVSVDGLFYVTKIQHQGDNFADTFESFLEVVAI